MSLLERKKKQWAEEREFLERAGIFTPAARSTAAAKTDKQQPGHQQQASSSSSTGAAVRHKREDSPEQTVLKLHQEQQRLKQQLQQQEQQQRQLEQQQREKSKQQQLYEQQQALRVDSQQIVQREQMIQQMQQASSFTTPPKSCGITIPEDYFNQRKPYKQNTTSSQPPQHVPTPPHYHPHQSPPYQSMVPTPYGYHAGYQYQPSPPPLPPQYLPQYQNLPHHQYQSPLPPQYGSTAPGSAEVLTVHNTPPSAAFRWPSSSDSPGRGSGGGRRRSSDSTGSSRAKWGDHGLGVGHLWDPTDTPGGRKDSLPPSWVETHSGGDNGLPGGGASGTQRKTHARGGGMASIDPEDEAERSIRQKRAEETQRVIQRQLEEKRRQREEEEERERREAAVWEERVREQQERDAREYQEELNRRRQKEEAEARRQAQLQEAYKRAEESAKRERFAKKAYLFNRTPSQGGEGDQNDMASNHDDVTGHETSRADERRGDANEPESPQTGFNRRKKSFQQTSSDSPKNIRKLSNQHENGYGPEASSAPAVRSTVSEGREAPSSSSGVDHSSGGAATQRGAVSLPPGSAPPSLGADSLHSTHRAPPHQLPPLPPTTSPELITARIKLLRALGLTPDYLVSSGLLDRGTLLSLLGVGYENNFTDISTLPSPSSTGNDGVGISSTLSSPDIPPYIRDRVLTPRKYRRPSRECGTQYEHGGGSAPGDRQSKSDESGSALNSKTNSEGGRRRRRSVRSSSNNDDKPQWNRHRSDRPYKKQTDKDPLVSRRLRKKYLTRSVSVSGCDTEESDVLSGADLPPSRRLKTWDRSRRESMSSDASRSPSPPDSSKPPTSHTRGPRPPPSMKQSLTPSTSTPRGGNDQRATRVSRGTRRTSGLSGRPPHRPPNGAARESSSSLASPSKEDSSSGGNTSEGRSGGEALGEDENNEERKETPRDNKDEVDRDSKSDKHDDNSNNDDNNKNSSSNEEDSDTRPAYVESRSNSPPVPALQKGGGFNIPEYAPGEGPPEVPYNPPVSAKPKKKKLILIKGRRPIKNKSRQKNDEDDVDISLNNNRSPSRLQNTATFEKERSDSHDPENLHVGAGDSKRNSINSPKRSSSNSPKNEDSEEGGVDQNNSGEEDRGVSKTSSQIDLTLQYYETRRSASPPVPAVQRRLQALAPSALPGLPPPHPQTSSRPPSAVLQRSSRPASGSHSVNRGIGDLGFAPDAPLPPPSSNGRRSRRSSTEASQSLLPQLPVSPNTTSLPSESESSPKGAVPQSPVFRAGSDSRRGSLTSTTEEDLPTVSVSSSGYESSRRSSDDHLARKPLPPHRSSSPSSSNSYLSTSKTSLDPPLVSPDKWEVLQSLSSLRQNLWRRQQEMIDEQHQQPEDDPFS